MEFFPNFSPQRLGVTEAEWKQTSDHAEMCQFNCYTSAWRTSEHHRAPSASAWSLHAVPNHSFNLYISREFGLSTFHFVSSLSVRVTRNPSNEPVLFLCLSADTWGLLAFLYSPSLLFHQNLGSLGNSGLRVSSFSSLVHK